jgi:hypothetical protein
MKRRILIVLVILSVMLIIAIPASASAAPCDYWAYRFWLAMASNNPVEANWNYSMWLGCTYRAMTGQ